MRRLTCKEEIESRGVCCLFLHILAVSALSDDCKSCWQHLLLSAAYSPELWTEAARMRRTHRITAIAKRQPTWTHSCRALTDKVMRGSLTPPQSQDTRLTPDLFDSPGLLYDFEEEARTLTVPLTSPSRLSPTAGLQNKSTKEQARQKW